MAAMRERNRRRWSNGIDCSEGCAVIREESVANSIRPYGGVPNVSGRAGGGSESIWTGGGGSGESLACSFVGIVRSPRKWVAVRSDSLDSSDCADARKGQFPDFLYFSESTLHKVREFRPLQLGRRM